jgi:hypothetical protein
MEGRRELMGYLGVAFRHLANANKFGHIRVVNNLLGLFVPALVTPLELLGGEHEPESEAIERGNEGER